MIRNKFNKTFSIKIYHWYKLWITNIDELQSNGIATNRKTISLWNPSYRNSTTLRELNFAHFAVLDNSAKIIN